ncbi:TPA: metallophosphoesterase [Photobacterium damselae]
MNAILNIIISDIHSNISNKDEINLRLSKLHSWIERKIKIDEFDKVVILVAGDIAYSGRKEEYDFVYDSFKKLADKYQIFLSPGNHDHDFSCYNDGSIRNILIESISSVKISSEVVNSFTLGQSEYYEFEKEICGTKPEREGILSKYYKISDELSIQALNTAWCSKIKEKGGELFFPASEILETEDKNEVKIIFFHHPLSWLYPDNNKEVRNKLSSYGNIIISGHEHMENSFKVDTDNNTNLIIETCSFHDNSLDDNGFITFYQQERDIIVQNHIWNGKDFENGKTKRKNEILEYKATYRSGFKVSNEFESYLKDIGTGFSHPEKEELSIDDVFVYPNISNFSKTSHSSVTRESSRDIFNNYSEHHVIISGDEAIGKTTLLKKLCLDSIKKGDFSAFLDGKKINRADRYKQNHLEKNVREQYEDFNFDDLLKSNDKKVLFIDDFHCIKGDGKSIYKMIKMLEKFFDKIVITVSLSYDLEKNQIQSENIFEEQFVSLEILKLGHSLRWELINKWNNLKSECVVSSQTLIKACDKAEKEMNRVIGENYIPSTPFFLLTMLQSMDTNMSSDLKTSSYGHYYHYLITCSLGLAGVDKDKLEGMFTYLTEMANYFNLSDYNEFSKEKMWEFNDYINQEYMLQIDCNTRLKTLLKAKILKETNDYYSFRYSYVAYYFLSKYIAENLNETSIDTMLDDSISKLNQTKNMSMLMFLTHHSKEPIILKKIVERTQSLFSENSACDLGNDVSFLNEILENIDLQELSYVDSDAAENRRIEAERKDKHECSNHNDVIEDDEDHQINNDDKLNDWIKEFNLTFKSVELLGQLTRNYHESLKTRPKLELLSEAIDAPLRALESMFSLMRDNSDTMITMLKSKIKDKFGSKKYEDSDIEKIATKLVFNMFRAVSFAIIKKISSAIGNEDLLPVIRKVNEGTEKTNAIRLIELSVQFDCGSAGSIEELKRMSRDFKSNGLADILLKDLVGYYLYMFSESARDKERICKAVNINYKPLLSNSKVPQITVNKDPVNNSV